MKRLLKIDELIIDDHFYLDGEDDCYYFVEYTARKGYSFSEGNKLIYNLKKSVSYRGTPAWRYKEEAISHAGQMIKNSLLKELDTTVCTLVSIPPSKTKDHDEYDDRTLRIIQQGCIGLQSVDIRELLYCTESIHAAHESELRPSVQKLEENLKIDEDLVDGVSGTVYLFDDVITTGAHFIACRNVLLKRFPNLRVVGIFVARRALQHDAEDYYFQRNIMLDVGQVYRLFEMPAPVPVRNQPQRSPGR